MKLALAFVAGMVAGVLALMAYETTLGWDE